MNTDRDVLQKLVVEMLEERGVTVLDIAKVTHSLQIQYLPDLPLETCVRHVERVLSKREVQNTIFTGLELDRLTEEGHIKEPLKSYLLNDYGLYGVDEVLALSIVNVYGSIGFTNFGYVDKTKPGIIGEIDKLGKKEGVCCTFIDDIVGAIAAAAASSIAHKYSVNDF